MAINIISQTTKDITDENGNVIDTANVVKVEFTVTTSRVGDIKTVREFEIPSKLDVNTYLQEQYESWLSMWSWKWKSSLRKIKT